MKNKPRRYWTYAHNIEDALRNGSFIRSMPGRPSGFARYMNGDFIDILTQAEFLALGGNDAARDSYAEVAEAYALKLIPKVCGGRG